MIDFSRGVFFLDIHCKFCKQVKPITRSHRKDRIYCSRKCYNLNHHTITKCLVCSKDFTHHKTKKRRFCSNACSIKSRYPDRSKNCRVCNEIFKITAVNVENIYCSKKCYDCSGVRSVKKIREKNPNFIGGKFSYRRYALRELPNFCCICHSAKKLDAHHIDSDRENNELWNLAILCHTCHMKYHKGTLSWVLEDCGICCSKD